MSNSYYSIQTFVNGTLEATTWINARNGEVQETGFTPSIDDVIVAGAIEDSPNWQAWNEFIFRNSAYNRMVGVAANQRAITRLEALSLRRFFQPEMLLFWNQFIDSVPTDNKPKIDEVQLWRNGVEINLMPFSFSDDGLMILR